jgi:large subunit ribosomal protein L5
MAKTMKETLATVYPSLKEEFGYKNFMQAPRVTKVVVGTGVGKIQDKQRLVLIQDRLAKITGQKTIGRPAKQSIASFKLREGEIIGYQATLRGPRMHDFLHKLIHLALPQTRDFRGLKVSAIDEMGNYTLGIKEHTIFPETADEEIKDVFGFGITIVTSAKTKKESEALLRHIGLPLQKAGTKVEKKPRKERQGKKK